MNHIPKNCLGQYTVIVINFIVLVNTFYISKIPSHSNSKSIIPLNKSPIKNSSFYL